jgi:chromate transporter
MQGLAAAAFLALFIFNAPFPLVILAAGIIGYIGAARGNRAFLVSNSHGPTEASALDDTSISDEMRKGARRAALVAALLWLVPVAALVLVLGPHNIFSEIAIFFSKMAVVTFGGAYAVLAYVAQQAVENFHWLKPGEMLDGLGMAETTPGPLVMVLQFVGFMGAFRDAGTLPPLLAATLGGLLATWVTFAPCFLWIFLGAPHIERLRENKAIAGALSAITAAVVGVILNLAVWFGVHTIFAQTTNWRGIDVPVLLSLNPAALALSIGAAYAIFRMKAGMLQVLAATSAAGVIAHLVGVI